MVVGFGLVVVRGTGLALRQTRHRNCHTDLFGTNVPHGLVVSGMVVDIDLW